jgi:hypothetical protein
MMARVGRAVEHDSSDFYPKVVYESSKGEGMCFVNKQPMQSRS